MSSLRDLLPAPRNEQRPTQEPEQAVVDLESGALPRQEVVSAPTPHGAGVSSTLALQVGPGGAPDFAGIARAGENASRVVHADHGALVEKSRDDEMRRRLARPDEAAVAETAKRTQAALEPIVQGKVAASLPSNFRGRGSDAKKTAEFIRYTPANTNRSHNSGAQQRIIKMVQAPVDPMEPPRFSQKKTPVAPPSPPVPVLHSPARKLTKEEAADWVVPPAISNWKNNRGYTVPLDKRLASDAAVNRDTRINDRFAALAETMYVAERTAREQVEQRAQIQRNVSLKAKEAKEKQLRDLAARAREERAGLGPRSRDPEDATSAAQASAQTGGGESRYVREETASKDREPQSLPSPGGDPRSPYKSVDEHDVTRSGVQRRSRVSRFGVPSVASGDGDSGYGNEGDQGDEDVRRRDEIREERRRERDRELRLREQHGEDASSRPTLKRSKLSRDRDRDIGEQVALGQKPTGTSAGEVSYDQRLFNQGSSARGMRAGFGGEDTDALYDRPLFEGGKSRFQYHPRGESASGHGDRDDVGPSTARFKPSAGLGAGGQAGAGDLEGPSPRDGPRTRPVEFERDTPIGDSRKGKNVPGKQSDPFGLNDMLGRMAKPREK